PCSVLLTRLFFSYLTPHTRSSPPFPYTPLFRSESADRSVITPFDVDIIAIPKPFITLGTLLRDTYFLNPGLLTLSIQFIPGTPRSEEYTSELQSREKLVCRLLLEKKKKNIIYHT